MAGGKADKVTTDRRIDDLYARLLDGWAAPRIVEYARQEFSIGRAQAYRLLDVAWQRVRDEGQRERTDHHARAVAAAYALLSDCERVKERLAAWHVIARLCGLYAAKGIELSTPATEDMKIQIVWGDPYDDAKAAHAARSNPIDYRQHIPPPDVKAMTDGQLEAMTKGWDLSALSDEQLEALADGRAAPIDGPRRAH